MKVANFCVVSDLPQAPEANTDTSLSRPQVDAAEGDKATLRCFFHGNPPPKITWRFGEVTVRIHTFLIIASPPSLKLSQLKIFQTCDKVGSGYWS